MENEKKNRIELLVEKLNEANRRYYIDNDPIMSDFEFDMQLYGLDILEKETGYILPYSPTQRVGSDIQPEFKEVKRSKVMGSIANCYDYGELEKWFYQFDPITTSFIIEPKYDGTSCSLIYENGVLVQASTRGDGYKGSDITANVKTIKNIPLKLCINETDVTHDWHYDNIYVPDKVEIRGEILMPKSVFKRLNEERALAGEQLFANERNAAAGSIKQLDPKVTASRGLMFKPYGLFADDGFMNKFIMTQHSMLDVAQIFGFDNPFYIRCTDKHTVLMMLSEFEDKFLHNEDYCMDGCVVKIDDVKAQEKIGYTQKVPKWAKAFKFKQEVVSTQLKGIDIQMGMSGQLSFVAVLEPVEVDGSIISKATLNNMDYIRNMDIHINDYVFVQKNGAVIPGITGVDYERNANEGVNRIEFKEPETCPFCGSILYRKDNGAHLYCDSESCNERMIQKLVHFVSKDCMDIEGMSIKTIRKLKDCDMIFYWYDLYNLGDEELVYAGVGKKMAKKIVEQIDKSKDADPVRILYALGIPMIGKVTAKSLIERFGSIRNLMEAKHEDVVDVCGKVAGFELYRYMSIHVIEFYLIFDIFGDKEIKKEDSGSILSGKKLMATGKLENFTRDSIVESIESNGGTYASSVSANLDYLIVGDKAGGSKVEKANKLGVKMITEQQYLEMIGQ